MDRSTAIFSSEPQFSSGLYDYVNSPYYNKLVSCFIPTKNNLSPNYLANYANAPYNTLKPSLCSIQSFVVWTLTGTSKIHTIRFNAVSAIPFRIDEDDNPTVSNSYWNFIPDSNLYSESFSQTPFSLWNNAGVITVPGFGFQYQGTGSALGTTQTTYSTIFNLSNESSDNPGVTARTYTLFATVDSSYTGSTYADITIEAFDMVANTVIASVSPSSASINTLVVPFTITSGKDVQFRIVLSSGLTVPFNSSVLFSNIGVMGGSQTPSYCITNNDIGWSWTPGGLYSTQIFNYPRMITICPIDVNGLGVSDATQDNLYSYLSSRREINFTTNVLQPNYVPIDVQWSAYVDAGYSVAVVTSAVNAAIRSFLNPAAWAGGDNSPPTWDGMQTTVRVFDIASAMGQVQGLGSILSVTIRQSYPTSGSYGVSDIIMLGIGNLPIANNVTGSLLTAPNNAYSGLG
jgi:hypothetical protein